VALAAVAGAAVAVTALLPAGHPARHQPGAQLTAWTVVKQPGGDVAVTIRELYNPAGLQRKLLSWPRGHPGACQPAVYR
jgi:hypothetical protein